MKKSKLSLCSLFLARTKDAYHCYHDWSVCRNRLFVNLLGRTLSDGPLSLLRSSPLENLFPGLTERLPVGRTLSLPSLLSEPSFRENRSDRSPLPLPLLNLSRFDEFLNREPDAPDPLGRRREKSSPPLASPPRDDPPNFRNLVVG